MGARKRNRAEQDKEAKKTVSFAKLNNCPTSPRKMRKVSDMIRGEEVFKALSILQFSLPICNCRFK
jgi:large subunit ribosomal protein L22